MDTIINCDACKCGTGNHSQACNDEHEAHRAVMARNVAKWTKVQAERDAAQRAEFDRMFPASVPA